MLFKASNLLFAQSQSLGKDQTFLFLHLFSPFLTLTGHGD